MGPRTGEIPGDDLALNNGIGLMKRKGGSLESYTDTKRLVARIGHPVFVRLDGSNVSTRSAAIIDD